MSRKEGRSQVVAIKELEPHDIPLAAAALKDLPLLRRYGVDASKLAKTMEQAVAEPTRVALGAWVGAWGSSGGDGSADPKRRGAEVAGVALFSTEGTFLMGGYLKLLAVASRFQGRALGRRLVQAMEERVGAQSSQLFVLVSHFNEGAKRFYEGLGYRRVGALPGLVLPEVTELLYWKELSER